MGALAGGVGEVPERDMKGGIVTATTRPLVTRFDASELAGSDFAGVEAWGGKYRTAIRTVIFDGARMDKLTYAGLKGLGADLSNVTVQ